MSLNVQLANNDGKLIITRHFSVASYRWSVSRNVKTNLVLLEIFVLISKSGFCLSITDEVENS